MLDSISSGFRAVADSQLGENAADIVSHSSFTQKESPGNFAVCFTLRDQHEYMFFLLSQGSEGRGFFFLGSLTDFLKDSLGNCGIE